MRSRLVTSIAALAVVLAACSSGATPAPSARAVESAAEAEAVKS